jgi:glutamine amidotransferase
MKIGIADYGLGNLLSIQSAFEKIGVSTVLTSKFSILKNVDGIVLPGVGAFSEAMESIKKTNLTSHFIN